MSDNFEFEDLMYFKQLDILKTDIFDEDEKEQQYKIISVNGGFKLTSTDVEICLRNIENINNNDKYHIDKSSLDIAVKDIQELIQRLRIN